jgi:uncharacterized protein with HEPN domain
MLDASREAVGFAKGRSRSDLDGDRLLTLGLLKCVEIVGEAAVHVTEGTREKFTNVSWLDIVGMRNRLVHVYFDIDLDLVWDTVTRDLPPMIKVLEEVLE